MQFTSTPNWTDCKICIGLIIYTWTTTLCEKAKTGGHTIFLISWKIWSYFFWVHVIIHQKIFKKIYSWLLFLFLFFAEKKKTQILQILGKLATVVLDISVLHTWHNQLRVWHLAKFCQLIYASLTYVLKTLQRSWWIMSLKDMFICIHVLVSTKLWEIFIRVRMLI